MLKLRASRSKNATVPRAVVSGRPPSRGESTIRVKRAPAASGGRLTGLTVLVVEDDADARYIFRHMLKLEGALVLEASEGGAALELCCSDARIDVILCDLLMPYLDGYGFIRGLRSLRRRKHIPVVAVTALTQDRDLLRTFNTGFARHLTKPVDSETLIQTILAVVSKTRP